MDNCLCLTSWKPCFNNIHDIQLKQNSSSSSNFIFQQNKYHNKHTCDSICCNETQQKHCIIIHHITSSHILYIQAVLVQLQPVMLSKFKHGNTYNKFHLVIHCPVGGHQKALGYLAGNQVESEQFLSIYIRFLPCGTPDIQVFTIYLINFANKRI